MRVKIKKIPEPTDSVGRSSRSTDKSNKKYGWLVFFIIFFWILFGLLINILAPDGKSYPWVGGSLFVALFLTLSLLFTSSKSGLLWSTAIILFLYFRLWGIGNVVNFFLILVVVVCVEFYFRQIKKGG